MGRLTGKIALISGAARGIGEAMARLFVAQGAFVYLTDIDDEVGQALGATLGPDASYRHLDVRQEADWQAVTQDILAEKGSLDIVVNNAGITACLQLKGSGFRVEFVQIFELDPFPINERFHDIEVRCPLPLAA
jgi:NAD(P)-dependent dehydrogenase (short-subunit alcohol dehydrogenase family)